MGYEQLPHVSLAALSTPLEELLNLRKVIGGPRLFMKRDDLNNFGMGGSKLRKLEYLLGDALAHDCDTIVATGPIQSNHARLTAAACAKLGLDCYLILTEPDNGVYEGNRILQKLFGAKQIFTDFTQLASDSSEGLMAKQQRAGDAKAAEIMAQLKREGHKPYLIPRGGSSLQGTASYVGAMQELKGQLQEAGIHPDHIFAGCATCSTLTGILMGCRVFGIDAQVHGISASRSAAEGQKIVTDKFNEEAPLLGYSLQISPSDVLIHDEYLGERYGAPTEKSREAQLLLARTEAILLDPVYTSKCMSGYIDMVRRGQLREDETAVIFHTGGTPLLFLNQMAQWVKTL